MAGRRRIPQGGETVKMSINVDLRSHARLHAIAKLSRRTLDEVGREAIAEYLANRLTFQNTRGAGAAADDQAAA
jgi:predicted transcriptional regulator